MTWGFLGPTWKPTNSISLYLHLDPVAMERFSEVLANVKQDWVEVQLADAMAEIVSSPVHQAASSSSSGYSLENFDPFYFWELASFYSLLAIVCEQNVFMGWGWKS